MSFLRMRGFCISPSIRLFGQSNGGVVITDLDLTDATNANATPLPATWTVMLIGLVGLGFIACRRQRLGVSFEAA